MLNALDWQGRAPTAYSFLHLFCHVLQGCSTLTVCVASYFAVRSWLSPVVQDSLVSAGRMGEAWCCLAPFPFVPQKCISITVSVQTHALAFGLCDPVYNWVWRSACLLCLIMPMLYSALS